MVVRCNLIVGTFLPVMFWICSGNLIPAIKAFIMLAWPFLFFGEHCMRHRFVVVTDELLGLAIP